MSRIRCVNIDWFEVYVLENQICNADFFRQQGFFVKERLYGTRVFKEVFTLEDQNGHSFLEVRRAPYTSSNGSSFMPVNAVHLRLVNRVCYDITSIEKLDKFICKFRYDFQRIKRVDVCLDFKIFDSGDHPATFIKRYLKGHYSKINQTKINAHGNDRWNARTWNSIKWGSIESVVNTKLYCKSMELKEKSDKPYIRQAWFVAGLIENMHYVSEEVWRLEFSINSGKRGWFTIEEDGQSNKKHSYKNTIDQWNTIEKIWIKFASLIPHYFRFKKFEADKRKDRCKDKILFEINKNDILFNLEKTASDSKVPNKYIHLMKKIEEYQASITSVDVRQACKLIIDKIKKDINYLEYGTDYDYNDIYILQRALSLKADGCETDISVLISKLKQDFKNEKEQPF